MSARSLCDSLNAAPVSRADTAQTGAALSDGETDPLTITSGRTLEVALMIRKATPEFENRMWLGIQLLAMMLVECDRAASVVEAMKAESGIPPRTREWWIKHLATCRRAFTKWWEQSYFPVAEIFERQQIRADILRQFNERNTP